HLVPTAIYSLSLHDALPIFLQVWLGGCRPLPVPRVSIVDGSLIFLLQLWIEQDDFRRAFDLQQVGQSMIDILQHRKWDIGVMSVDRKSTRLNSSHDQISYAV